VVIFAGGAYCQVLASQDSQIVTNDLKCIRISKSWLRRGER
jgi:hypothetical protein